MLLSQLTAPAQFAAPFLFGQDNEHALKASTGLGILTDAGNLYSQHQQQQKKKTKTHPRDILATALHYTNFLTQFFAFSPELKLANTVFQLVHATTELKKKNWSAALSDTSNALANYRMLDRMFASYGNTWYGKIKTHPHLRYLHDELKTLDPGKRSEEVVLGKLSFLRSPLGQTYNNRVTTRSNRLFPKKYAGSRPGPDAERPIIYHEYAHYVSNRLHPNLTSESGTSHHGEWKSTYHDIVLKGHAHGFFDQDNVEFLNHWDRHVQHNEEGWDLQEEHEFGLANFGNFHNVYQERQTHWENDLHKQHGSFPNYLKKMNLGGEEQLKKMNLGVLHHPTSPEYHPLDIDAV